MQRPPRIPVAHRDSLEKCCFKDWPRSRHFVIRFHFKKIKCTQIHAEDEKQYSYIKLFSEGSEMKNLYTKRNV